MLSFTDIFVALRDSIVSAGIVLVGMITYVKLADWVEDRAKKGSRK